MDRFLFANTLRVAPLRAAARGPLALLLSSSRTAPVRIVARALPAGLGPAAECELISARALRSARLGVKSIEVLKAHENQPRREPDEVEFAP